jgi:phage baseplate assembly protein W
MEQNLINQTGLVFPIVIEDGKAKEGDIKELVFSSLLHLNSWDVGHFPFNPLFGSRKREIYHAPNNPISGALVKAFTREAINLYEKRIEILDIAVSMPIANKLTASVKFKIKTLSTIQEITL